MVSKVSTADFIIMFRCATCRWATMSSVYTAATTTSNTSKTSTRCSMRSLLTMNSNSVKYQEANELLKLILSSLKWCVTQKLHSQGRTKAHRVGVYIRAIALSRISNLLRSCISWKDWHIWDQTVVTLNLWQIMKSQNQILWLNQQRLFRKVLRRGMK